MKEGEKELGDVPSPVSMSSALPYLGAVRDVAEPWGLSTWIACSEVYVVTSGGAEWFSVMKHITGSLILMAELF